MRRIILIGVIAILILSGCESKEIQPINTNMGLGQEVPQEQEPQPPAPPETQTPQQPEIKAEGKKCANFDIPEHYIDSIDLTLFTEGLNKTEEGFKFRLIPLDKEKNIIPVTGNLQVSFWSTKETSEGRAKENEIYTAAFYIKKEDVVGDCSSKEMEIKFENIKVASRYDSVSKDDPGIIRFRFIRTGSQDQFEKEYNAAEFNERVFP